MAEKLVRALQIHGLTGAGATNTEPIELVVKDPMSGVEIREDDGTPSVVIVLRAMSGDEHQKLVESFTTMEKANGARGVHERIDHAAIGKEILRRVICDWHGIIGSDGLPLVCNNHTKVLLPESVKLQVSLKVFSAEVAEVLAATFRQSPDVSGMVRGYREEHAVLHAGQG